MSARRIARRLGWRIAPGPMADRARRHNLAVRTRIGVPEAVDAWVAEHGERVVAGPFTGLRYPVELLRRIDAPIAKMTGAYEATIMPVIGEMIKRLLRGGVFLNFGCADGLFAVGVANAAPAADVHAFDLSRSARQETRHLADTNAARIALHGGASEAAVLAYGPMTKAVLCDIEGSERTVMTSRAAEALAGALSVIELHAIEWPEVREEITERFSKSHGVALVEAPPDEGEPGVNEMRWGGAEWAVCRPRR